MKSYNIHKNRKKLSSEEIESFKDFGALMNKFEAEKPQSNSVRSGIKSKWIIYTATISTTLIIAGVIWHLLTSTSEIPATSPESMGKELPEYPSYVNPPMEGMDIPYQTVAIAPGKDNSVKFDNGVTVAVPAQSIIDEKGNAMSDTVILKFREFTNPAEIFLAGIPMEYDSAGTKYTFESAGMIELYAVDKAGNRLQVAPGKSINVSIKSANADPDFNLYSLDTVGRNWKYEGRDIKITDTSKDKRKQQQKSKSVEQTVMLPQEVAIVEVEEIKEPVKPIKMDETKKHFTIQVDEKAFPELTVYKNMQFEVDESYVKFVESDGDITWSGVKIEKSPIEMMYMVTFSNPTQKKTYRAKPVLKDLDYQAAMKKYDADYSFYQQKLTERKAEEERLRKERLAEQKRIEEVRLAQQKDLEKRREEIRKQQEEQIKAYNEANKDLITERKISREFSINRFGFWNCDQVWTKSRTKKMLSAALYNDTLITRTHVYIANFTQNILINFYQNFNNYIFPGEDYVIWSVSKDNKIVYITKERAEKVEPDKHGKYTLDLVELEQKLEKPEDFVSLFKNGFKNN